MYGRLTCTVNIFLQTQDAVNGSVGEDSDIVCVEEDIKDIENISDVMLPGLVHFLIHCVFYLHCSESSKH